jgi:hypothetical protein
MLDTTSTATLILLAAATTLLLTAMLYPSSLLRWLQRKRYQYEVTFSLYMLTPTEKFIFSMSTFPYRLCLRSSTLISIPPLMLRAHPSLNRISDFENGI